jgi:UDPglucose--hexose-1-phosphate uridylyltransferase
MEDKRWRSILVYKNQGAAAGATLDHGHSQLIALPAVPRELAAEVEGAKGFFDATQRCIYCAVIAQEKSYRKRLVTEQERFVVFCPFASRFPYETWIFPKAHQPSFEKTDAQELDELAHTFREMLRRLDVGLKNPPFNYVLHTSPRDTPENYFHWHIEIMPKLTQAAGFEWGSGWTINPVPPEDAAALLREALE